MLRGAGLGCGYSQYQLQIKGIPNGITEIEIRNLIKELNGGEYPLVFCLHRTKGNGQECDGTGQVKFSSSNHVNDIWLAAERGIKVPGYSCLLNFDPTWIEFCVPNATTRAEAGLPDRNPRSPRYARWNEFDRTILDQDQWLHAALQVKLR